MENEFPVQLTLRIDWSELDYFGHVNNVAFFKYIQSARIEYWDAIGLRQSHLVTGFGPVLASSQCQFLLPLYFPGEIKIYTKMDFIKNTSFCFSHQIHNEKNQIVANAQDVMVMYDFNSMSKIPVNEEFKAAVKRLENKEF